MNVIDVNIHKDDSNSEPMIKIPSSAFGEFRRELIDTLGIERAKGFLLRYGWNCGKADVLQLKDRKWDDPIELIMDGPKQHMANGHVEVRVHSCDVDIEKGTLHFEGDWIHSYEARETIKLYGLSDVPVCYSLAGYASGCLTTIMGKKVIAKETQCMAMGHDHCHWVCKTVEEWNGDDLIEKEIHYYETDRINQELEDTYEELRIERDTLSLAYDVHQKMIKEVTYETGIQSIVDVLHKSMKTPVMIESVTGEPRVVAGISMDEASQYSNEFKQWLEDQERKKGNIKQQINQTLFLTVSPNHRRVISPIYLRQKIYGYLSFITEKNSIKEADKMILGQATQACSLYLLNERTRFNSEYRIRGSFLDDILNGRITMSEIMDRIKYIDFELKSPYFIVSIHRDVEQLSIKDEMEFDEQFMNDLFTFLKKKQVNGLVGQKAGNVVILFSETALLDKGMTKDIFCRQLLTYCSEKYPESLFKMGVSVSYSKLEEAPEFYHESTSALKLATAKENLIFFDSLGVVGLLLQTKEKETIERYADKILGRLLEEDLKKNMELSNTLYQYLENGSNVYQTARTMNFSVNGLRYRLGKINELLQIDINHANNKSEIYVALQCLIVLGKLNPPSR